MRTRSISWDGSSGFWILNFLTVKSVQNKSLLCKSCGLWHFVIASPGNWFAASPILQQTEGHPLCSSPACTKVQLDHPLSYIYQDVYEPHLTVTFDGSSTLTALVTKTAFQPGYILHFTWVINNMNFATFSLESGLPFYFVEDFYVYVHDFWHWNSFKHIKWAMEYFFWNNLCKL